MEEFLFEKICKILEENGCFQDIIDRFLEYYDLCFMQYVALQKKREDDRKEFCDVKLQKMHENKNGRNCKKYTENGF